MEHLEGTYHAKRAEYPRSQEVFRLEVGPEEKDTWLDAVVTLPSSSLGNVQSDENQRYLENVDSRYSVDYRYKENGTEGEGIPESMRDYVPLLKESIGEAGYPADKMRYADEHERAVYGGELPPSLLATHDDVWLLDRLRYAEETGESKDEIIREFDEMRARKADALKQRDEKFQEEMR